MVEYINSIISELNKDLGVCLTPKISEDTDYRYPMNSNCVDKTIYVWKEFFSALTEEQKKLHIVYAYSALLAAKLYGKERIIDGHKSIELPFNPNKIAMKICERININFSSFAELQREVYEIRQRLFPYPDFKSSYYRVSDEIRKGARQFKVIDVNEKDGIIIVKIQAINGQYNNSQNITCPELELISSFRIEKPFEFTDG